MSSLILTSETLAGSPSAGQIEYNGQFYGTDSNSARAQMQRITLGTAVASTSGTSIDFTGIPSWVKRITVHFYNVAMGTATTSLVLQLGTSGGFVTTGYASSSGYTVTGGANGFSNSTNGMCFGLMTNNATQVLYGTFVLTTIGGNIWVGTGINAVNSNALISANSGYLSLGGVLTQLQMTTIAGTGTFSAGTFNILYE